MVAAGIAHGDEAVEGVVFVPYGAAVEAASPHDAAEVVAELANGGRGGRILGARRGFSACGVDEAVGVDGVLQAPARVVAPVAPAAGVVADRGESALCVVAQGLGLLETRAASAAFERPSFGVVEEGVEHAECAGVPAQVAVLVPLLKPVRGGRRGIARFDRAPECVVFEVLCLRGCLPGTLEADGRRLQAQVVGVAGAQAFVVAHAFQHAGRGIVLERAAPAAGQGECGEVVSRGIPVEGRNVGVGGRALGAVRQRPVGGGEQGAALDPAVGEGAGALDWRRAARGVDRLAIRVERAEAALHHARDLARVVVGELQSMLALRDDAGACDKHEAGRIVGVLVANEQAFGQRLAADKGLQRCAQHAAGVVALKGRGHDRLARWFEPRDADESAALVVLVAHVRLAAACAARADRLQQAGFAVDAGVAVGGALAEAVGEYGPVRRGEFQIDLLDSGAGARLAGLVRHARCTAHAHDRAAAAVVSVGRQPPLACFPLGSQRSRWGEGDSGEMVRPRRRRFAGVGAVVVAPDGAVGVAGGDQVAQPRTRTLVLVRIGEAPERAGDRDHPPKTAAAAWRVLEGEAAPLRIGHLHQLAIEAAREAEEFAGGHADLHELAACIEVQRASVGPAPAIRRQVWADPDSGACRDRAAGGVCVTVVARPGRIGRKHKAGAVGLDDVQLRPRYIQIGLVRQPPAAPEQSERRIGAGLRAVVMAHDLDAEHARQRGQVGLALVLVAGDDVDRVARAMGDTVRVVLARGRRLAAGVRSGRVAAVDREAVRVEGARLREGLLAGRGENAAARCCREGCRCVGEKKPEQWAEQWAEQAVREQGADGGMGSVHGGDGGGRCVRALSVWC